MILLVIDAQIWLTDKDLYEYDKLVKGTNTTFDNPYMDKEKTYKYYNEFMWPGRFAECISVEETIQRMQIL